MTLIESEGKAWYRGQQNSSVARRFTKFHTTAKKNSPDDDDLLHVQVNREARAVSTPVGDLPVSPLMDPVFLEARQRFTNTKPARSPFKTTKFQRQLARNPYARALATPPRKCPITSVVLPKFFLERFALVAHPTTGKPHFVPQDLESKADGAREPHQGVKTGPTGYVLSRQLLFQELLRERSPHFNGQKKLMRMSDHRSHYSKALSRATWRGDMDSFLLELMRRRVVESLLHFAAISEKEDRKKYLVKCETWDSVRELKHRGCLLFLGRPDGAPSAPAADIVPPRLSTMTIEGVKWGWKLAVHNLLVLLGEEHSARLRRDSELLRDGSLYLLGRQATVKLQMLLWKLQGYMAWETSKDVQDMQTPDVAKPTDEPQKRTTAKDPGERANTPSMGKSAERAAETSKEAPTQLKGLDRGKSGKQ